MHALFTAPVLRVEQPRGVPAAKSRYTVRDGHGVLLAEAAERDVPVRRQLLRAAFGGVGGDPRTVRVDDPAGVPLLTIAKPKGTAGAAVLDPSGGLIGDFRQNRHTYAYSLHDAAGNVLGALNGDRLGRRFAVHDASGTHVAQIDKKWAGLGKELLTTADRYTVDVRLMVTGPLRVLITAAAMAIDMMHYEEKDVFG